MNEDETRYARLFEILTKARALQGPDRERYLSDACADDRTLRTEVDALLTAADDQLEDALADSNVEARRTELEAAFGTPDSSWLPERIGDYTILRQLGQGGMGIVYEAEQESPKRRVAIKLLHPMHATIDRLRRFRQEAELLGRLQHPGIAQIHEAGTYDVGRGPQPFFAMELIDGVDFISHCERNQLDRRARLELLAQVADSVQYAHDHGVIHRDLKPDNVLIDTLGRPRILDFGIARTTSGSAALSTVVTDAGQLVGTLGYMAPEQLAGSGDSAATQTDVYALGVLGFELLTGRAPRDINDLSISQVITLLTRSDPPRAGTIDANLRGDIEIILGKALEPEPARRYATAGGLAADLRRFLNDQPIRARAPSRVYLATKFTRRHPALVWGTSATVITLIIGVAVSLFFANRADDQRELAEENETLAVKHRHEAINGLLQSVPILLDAGRPRDAAEQLQLIPRSFRGVAWQLLDRSVPHVVEAPRCDWRFFGDEHLVGAADGGLIVYSLIDKDVGPTLFAGVGLVRVESCTSSGLGVAVTPERAMVLDLETEQVQHDDSRYQLSTDPRDDGRRILRLPEVSDDGRVVIRYPTANRAEVRVEGKLVRTEEKLAYVERVHVGPDGRYLVINRREQITVIDLDADTETETGTDTETDHGAIRFRHKIPEGTEATGQPVRGGILLLNGPEQHSRHYERRVWRRIAIPESGPPLEVTDPFTSGFDVPRSHQVGYDFSYPVDGRFVVVGRETAAYAANSTTGDPLGFGCFQTDVHGQGGWLPYPDHALSRVVVSPSGSRLVIAGTAAKATMLELDGNSADVDPRCVVLRGHRGVNPDGSQPPEANESGWIYHVAVSHDGSLIASSAPLDSMIRLWDTRTGELVATLERKPSNPGSWDALMVFSADDARLFLTTSFDNRQVALVEWRLLTGESVVHERLPEKEVRHLELLDAFLRVARPEDRTRLSQHAQMHIDRALVGFYPPKPQLSDLPPSEEGERWSFLRGHEGPCKGVGLHPTQSRAAVVQQVNATRAGHLKIVDPTTGDILAEHQTQFAPWCCAYSPDGSVLAIGTNEGRVLLYETKYYTKQLEWIAHSSYIYSIAWTPDGTRLVTASGDATLKVWDTRTRVKTRRNLDEWQNLLREVSTPKNEPASLNTLRGDRREAARIELIRRAHTR